MSYNGPDGEYLWANYLIIILTLLVKLNICSYVNENRSW